MIQRNVTPEEVVEHIYNSIEGYEDEEENWWSLVETDGDTFFFHVEASDGSRQQIFKFRCVESWSE